MIWWGYYFGLVWPMSYHIVALWFSEGYTDKTKSNPFIKTILYVLLDFVFSGVFLLSSLFEIKHPRLFNRMSKFNFLGITSPNFWICQRTTASNTYLLLEAGLLLLVKHANSITQDHKQQEV